MVLQIDPFVFSDAAISEETRQVNDQILALINATPDPWTIEPRILRMARAAGRGPFGPVQRSPRAETLTIEGPHGAVPLRVFRPEGRARGVFLHIHGGGWVLGASDQQDVYMERIVNACGYVVISVEYRLAPECPYPMGPDDCEAAALWLAQNAEAQFGTTVLTIGGESAGAHLAVVSLIRLRDKHGLTPYAGAVLTAGCYDLGLTPSAKAFGLTRLVLSTRDIEMFVRHFLVRGGSVEDPDVSPLKADLQGLPRALFTVGTRDALLDDTLFMAMRWMAARSPADVEIYPGGAHVFQRFPSTLAEANLARIDRFLDTVALSA